MIGGWRVAKPEQSGWVSGAVTCVPVAVEGGKKSVNSWDIRHPDLASGGREDGLVTTDQLRKHKRERRRE